MEANRAALRDQVPLGQALLLLVRLTVMADAERAAFADRVETYRRHRQ